MVIVDLETKSIGYYCMLFFSRCLCFLRDVADCILSATQNDNNTKHKDFVPLKLQSCTFTFLYSENAFLRCAGQTFS